MFSEEKKSLNKTVRIQPEMTVLEVVRTYKQTENVFKKYDAQAGECIMCTALFESLKGLSERFRLNLKKLIEELETATK